MNANKDQQRKTRQLKLAFPEPSPTLDELAVSSANRKAVSVLRRWPDWRTHALAVVGPAKSGLTTAARAWAVGAGGEVIAAKAFDKLSHKKVEALASRPVAIDPADKVTNEDNLLSLINLSSRLGGSVLLTGQKAPALWRVKQPDLASRLKSMTLVELGPPDDEMVSVRLRAAMKRRFLKLPDDVEAYLLMRIERNYAVIETFVESLHEMAEGREVTVPLARDVLDDQAGTRPLFDNGEE